jgi:hypothetical protein
MSRELPEADEGMRWTIRPSICNSHLGTRDTSSNLYGRASQRMYVCARRSNFLRAATSRARRLSAGC